MYVLGMKSVWLACNAFLLSRGGFQQVAVGQDFFLIFELRGVISSASALDHPLTN